MTDGLRAFIEARLAEDERDALEAEGNGNWDCPSTGVIQLGGIKDLDGLVVAPRAVAYHIERHDPARVLREVAAKRAVLAIADDSPEQDWDGRAHQHWLTVDKVLRALAAVWADHPDYLPEWAPETVVPGG